MAVRTIQQDIAEVLKENRKEVIKLWTDQLKARAKGLVDALGEARLKSYISDNLDDLIKALPEGENIEAKPYADLRRLHERLCEELAEKGANPAEVPLYAFAKRDAIQSTLLKAYPDKARMNNAVAIANKIVEGMSLYIFDYFIKSREKQVQAASQYTRSLIEASLDPLVTISLDGKITDVNEATVKVTGVSREKLIGADFSDYFSEPDKAREGYQMVFAKGSVTDYPLTIRRKDGKLTDVLYNASVYKDISGKVLGVFAAARDITTQKQASQYARSLIEASLDPLVTISPEGKITDVNEATVKVTGVDREKLIGADFSDYFTEPEKAREGYQMVFAKGFVTDYPLTIRRKDGRLTDVLYNASVYRDASGKVLGVFAAARDITEQKQASQYARSLIEASLDPLVTISPDGKITDVNEATVKVTGIPRKELIGSDFSEYFTEPQKAREGYKKVFSEGVVKDYPLAIRHTTGKIAEVLYNASVYKNEAGEVQGVFAAARDVTELKRAEEELKKAQQKALLELSAPVVKVWDKILMIPLIGMMDSSRAQLVMETLLTAIEESQAKVAILDVSGIPVVDSLVAKHLIRTVAAAKLMGAECIVTGIRSKISQTVIQLGIDLSEITTKTTLADAIKIALDLTGQKVTAK